MRAACRCAPRSIPSCRSRRARPWSTGLVSFDESKGYRGPITKIDTGGDWGIKLADVKSLADIEPWRMAVVLDVNDQSARIGLQPPRDPGGNIVKQRDTGIVPLEGVKWARPAKGRSLSDQAGE